MTNDYREPVLTAGALRVMVAERLGWQWVIEDADQPDAVPYLVMDDPDDEKRQLTHYLRLVDKHGERYRSDLPNWPGDIGAAWELAEQLYSDGWVISIGSLAAVPRGWRCELTLIGDVSRQIEANGNTAAEAICWAWLLAMGGGRCQISS